MSPFLQLILTLVIVITGAKAGGWVANRLRQPAVLGELLAGVLLGPSVLNLLNWTVLVNGHDPHLLTETVFELAELGVVCLMFLAGLEIDPHEMRRAGRVATWVGVSGVIEATEQAVGGDFGAPDTGILFVIPVTRALGMRPYWKREHHR